LKLSKPQITIFQNKILTWYAQHQRDLPWRVSRGPYRILVSEIMLQQTQVSRVIPKYKNWLQAFPTVQDLAAAKTSEVLALWSGLGYNRRALNLKKTAEIVVAKYAGKFPSTEKELLALPGIGMYTARAVLCFAFNQQVSVVDINVKKVILTQIVSAPPNVLKLGDAPKISRTETLNDKEIALIADQLLPQGKAYEWNQALMDYSSIVLKKEKIVIPKQSKFLGSRRYYRGQVLKQLLDKREIALEELGSLIKKNYVVSEKGWLDSLVMELKEEGFIEIKKDFISLTS
jgi:A/G-specific adenine glycosylase